MMRVYDDNDMDAPGMESAKAGLDALVDELKTAELSKVNFPRQLFPYIQPVSSTDL